MKLRYLASGSMLIFGCVLAEDPGRSSVQRDGAFEIEALAPGVEVMRHAGPGVAATNSLVIDRSDGLLVVDAQPSPEIAAAMLGVVSRRHGKPVRYLVFTHPHLDAIGGAKAFPQTTLRIGSLGCHEALSDLSFDVAAETRDRLSNPASVVEPERLGPVLVTEAPIALEDPVHRVEIYPLPPGHSSGDLLVVLPALGIVAAGDLVWPDRCPWTGEAHLRGWIGRLNDLAVETHRVIVPLRGPSIDVTEVRRQRDGFAWITGRVASAFIDRVPPEEIIDYVLTSDRLSDHFDADVRPDWLRLFVRTAIREAEAERRRRGLP